MMRKISILTLLLSLSLVLMASGVWGEEMLGFKTMAGVSGPFLGTDNPIRGINGGGLPWVLDSAEGKLETDGRLEISVEGLVLADDPAVPENLRLTNPVPNFRGVVSCLIIDETGTVGTFTASTDNFPANQFGDSEIEAIVELPESCFAPIVFVTSPGLMWFSVTGN